MSNPMHSRRFRRIQIAAALLSAAATLPASAVDGVVLIDQNNAIAGGVTPGDTAGYPISINQPGSYRLSGNLTVPTGANGIEVNVDGVNIDLNGFSIIGPGVYPNGSFAGISSVNQRIAVTNGQVVGFLYQLNFAGAARFITLSSLFLDGTGLKFGTGTIGGLGAIIGKTRSSNALVKDVIAQGQIQVTCPAVFTNSSAQIIETTPGSPVGYPFPTNCKGGNVIAPPFD